MAIRMKALRAVYSVSQRKEYAAGEDFTVTDQREADRMVRSRRAKILGASAAAAAPQPKAAPVGDDLSAIRTEYREVLGKPPFHGWDAAALKQKIAEYRTTNMGDSTLTTHLTAN